MAQSGSAAGLGTAHRGNDFRSVSESAAEIAKGRALGNLVRDPFRTRSSTSFSMVESAWFGASRSRARDETFLGMSRRATTR